MYFGEFLLIKNIINEEQLLDALIYQTEHLPSFLRVLREEKIISTDEIFRMIQLQLENNSDLISVLKNENKIDEKRLHGLYQKQLVNRKMLGSVLVELKFVEQSVIEKMLHEFLRDKENLHKNLKQEVALPVQEKVAEVEISEAALESLRELGLSDEDFVQSLPKKEDNKEKKANIFVDEFLSIFNEKMNNKLNKLTKILMQSAQDESDISNYYNSLYRDLFILKGAAMLAELNFTMNILNEWGSLIEEKLMLNNNDLLKKWSLNALPMLDESIIYLWEIREIISCNKDEENIQNTPALQAKYLHITSALKAIK